MNVFNNLPRILDDGGSAPPLVWGCKGSNGCVSYLYTKGLELDKIKFSGTFSLADNATDPPFAEDTIENESFIWLWDYLLDSPDYFVRANLTISFPDDMYPNITKYLCYRRYFNIGQKSFSKIFALDQAFAPSNTSSYYFETMQEDSYTSGIKKMHGSFNINWNTKAVTITTFPASGLRTEYIFTLDRKTKIDAIPAPTSGDNGKVLGVSGNNYALVEPGGGTEIQAGSFTIATGSWSGTTATKTITGLTNDDVIKVAPMSKPDAMAWAAANIWVTQIGDTLTLSADTTPTASVSVVYEITKGVLA